MASLNIAADLNISSETHQITILSNDEEVGIAIQGETLPILGISSLRALKLLRSLPEMNLNQRIRIVYNQKEIYRSDKSLFRQSGKLTLLRLFFKNLF
ncbi:hypothetical protein [Algoriphagus namhaensis]